MDRTDDLCEGERDCASLSECLLPVRGSAEVAAPCPSQHDTSSIRNLSIATQVSKGTFLQENIVLRGDYGEVLIARVMDDIARRRQLKRKRHASEIQHERQLLSCVLANGLRCHWFRITGLVSFQRKADVEFYNRRNRPAWLSAQSLGRIVERLVEAGLARKQVGRRGVSSGYQLNETLLRIADDCGVSVGSLGIELEREDLVRLKAPRPKRTFDPLTGKVVRHAAERIYFYPTAETEYWRDELSAYNEFVASQDIAIELTNRAVVDWVNSLNNDDLVQGAKLRRPELFRAAIYRVFNDATADNPTFDKGGRLAGGWWMNAPEKVRALVSINGEPTVELDYSACHPRMLYHELGLEGPSDPYQIARVTALEREQGCEAGTYRDVVKWQTQVLINGGSRPDLVAAPSDIPHASKLSLSDIRRFIREAHEPISSAFRSRAGLRLMKAEADIAFAIISKARRQGWLALPIHDAFIVQSSMEKELRGMMIDEYQTKFGYPPTITKKRPADRLLTI